MDPQAPSNLPTNQDLSFQVMPQEGGNTSFMPPVAVPPAAQITPNTPPPPPSTHSPLSYDPGPSFFRSWKFYTILAVAAALILGVAGWFLFGSENPRDETTEPVTKLPKVWLKQ